MSEDKELEEIMLRMLGEDLGTYDDLDKAIVKFQDLFFQVVTKMGITRKHKIIEYI